MACFSPLKQFYCTTKPRNYNFKKATRKAKHCVAFCKVIEENDNGKETSVQLHDACCEKFATSTKGFILILTYLHETFVRKIY